HPYGDKAGKYYTTLLTISPAGDDLTLDFAKAAIENEKLGADEIPDYLAVSFSSTDYVGHMFGPSSLESEENILRLDRTLADLFSFVDKRVGLKNTLIVLSADHGAPEAPGYLNELGIEARYVDVDAWDKAPAIAALKERFGLGEELIETYFHPYLYLNRTAIAERNLDPAEVENAVAAELEKFDGVALAVPSKRLLMGETPNTPAIEAVLNNFNPLRSGDIYIVFEPHSFINAMDGLTVTSTHGSPWTYDTYVPIVFAGAKVSAQRVTRATYTIDVAPTLSAYIGAKPPSGSVGTPLGEVVGR
ncbi:MAG: alkaline phosphatase family protein, partial [Proteobacteria bacterium]|nr:alkaline phosphatase family protein [Pseudomonadota bacterium]